VSKQHNTILYSHRLDTDNPGDLWSCPKEYFFNGVPHQTVDVLDHGAVLEDNRTNCYITGGGNILVSDKWTDWNRAVLTKVKDYTGIGKLRAVWGAGINFDNPSTLDYLSHFDLIGTRVYKKKYPNSKYSFVPCVSVMNKLLDKEYEQKFDVAIIPHFKIPLPDNATVGRWQDSKSVVRLTNKPATIEDMIQAIGESETVITSSYHATYWAMLMNKRVICHIFDDTGVRDFVQRKLETFERKPIYIYGDGTFGPELLKKTYDYSGMKEEYRELNINFHEKIVNELDRKGIKF
jgi:hypothetical protein